MSLSSLLNVSQLLVGRLSSKIFRYFKNPISSKPSLLVASKYRNFLDAPNFGVGARNLISFACHPYMGQVALLREVITE